MENKAISTHVTVINQGGAKLPEAKANGLQEAGADTDFANVLAAQIEGEVLATELSSGAKPGPAGSDQALLEQTDQSANAPESATAINNAPAPNPLIDALNVLPLPPVLQTVQLPPVSANGSFEERGDKQSITSTDLVVNLDKAAKEVADPAKLAVSDKALPLDALREVKVETSNLSSVSPTNPTQLNRATPLPTSPTPTPLPAVAVPVGHAGWDAAFSQRVAWVATNNQQVAQLQLNPPNLGPIEIRISLSSDQANAAFTSPHAAVREAIEAALPRLREMLADNGLSLGNVNVSSQSFQQQAQTSQGDGQRYDPLRELQRIATSGGNTGLATQGIAVTTHNGLVDIFA